MFYFAFKYLAPILMPFIMGFLLALLVRPLAKLIKKIPHVGSKFASVIATIIFFVALSLFLTMMGSELVGYIKKVLGQLPGFYTSNVVPVLNRAYESVMHAVERANADIAHELETAASKIISDLGSTVSSISVKLLGVISGIAGSLPQTVLSAVITIVSTFFIAADFDDMSGFLVRQISAEKLELAHRVIEAIHNVTGRFVRGYLLIMLVTFCEASLGYWILGVDYFPVIAAVTAVVDIFPVLGTGTVVLPWAAIELLSGGYVRGLGLIVLYAIITVVRQIIEPKIIGRQVGLHPVVMLMSMYVGTKLFGGIGLFGMPIALSVINALNSEGIIKLYK